MRRLKCSLSESEGLRQRSEPFFLTKTEVVIVNSIMACRHYAWFQRLGAASFFFFLVKGLLWVAAPFVLLWFG